VAATGVHMVGIGGAGMSALARIYLEQGRTVSGSDETASTTLAELARLGATVHVGHAASHVGSAALVVYSSAVPANNPELREAERRGLRMQKHAQALGELFNARRGIAVAGTHGKTTTTSMIAFALERCGWQPAFQVGGELVDLNTSARWGSGEWMVIEADEFDRRFLEYRPEVAVVTNAEPDHFEYYTTVEEMYGAFAKFLSQVLPGGTVVACGEDERLTELVGQLGDRHIVRYGIASAESGPPPGWQWWTTDVRSDGGQMRCTVHCGETNGAAAQAAHLVLAVPGRHNVLNATAALAACSVVGVPLDAAAAALREFHGARRRLQLIGKAGGVGVYESYAHHPTEVRADLDAMRPLVPPAGRLWTVFQPHLLVRTERLFDQFARAFVGADRVVVTDVYSPSGREPAGAYRGSRELVHAMRHVGAAHIGEPARARALLAAELRPRDVVLIMGAGPIVALAAEVVRDLAARQEGDEDTGT
jgi:UDP-N-acetylmuramate--alanine ligase